MSAEDEKVSFTLASYFPGAFAIELEAFSFTKPDGGPGIPIFDPETFPIFMHEVAHLVQDRSTFRGVMDFLDMWDQIEAAAIYARAGGPGVPFPIVELASSFSRLTADYSWAVELGALRRHREPKRDWTDDRFWAFEDYSVEFLALTLKNREIKYPFITVHLVDNPTGEQYSHPLGAWEIKEACSVAVGLLHGGSEMRPADWFEYLVIERILGRHFGEVSPQQTIALCHWALQDLAPANTLFTLIEGIERNFHGALPGAEEIYDFARREAFSRGFEQNCRDVIAMLRQIEASMQAQEEHLGNMFRWFRVHAERLLELHLVPERRFPLDTFLCQPSTGLRSDERQAALGRFFAEVEVPLIVWPEGEHYSISNTQGATAAVFLNRCVVDLFQRLWTGHEAEWQCPIYAGCELAMKDNIECRTRPWRKNLLNPTCPYGMAANVLGLNRGSDPVFVPLNPPGSRRAKA